VSYHNHHAGSSCPCQDEYAHWKQTFFDHLEAAYHLHHIEDVYILEHRHCGAYNL
jgi:hypothetical protein